MSEKITKTPESKRSSPDQSQNLEQLDQDRKMEAYYDLGSQYEFYEQDGLQVSEVLKKLLLANEEEKQTDDYKLKFDKFKRYFELDESTISDIEKSMASAELELELNPKNSIRFIKNDNDILVNSSILYPDRIESLRLATDNDDIDKPFVDAIIAYASAVEHDENSVISTRYEDDIQAKQEYFQNCQRRRSLCHNDMISKFNTLNDLALSKGLKPLTYRNLATNSAINNYKNTPQMHHDRVSLAHYVAEMINHSQNKRLPNPKYIQET